MADLDGLKRANDTYGHLGGDVVLQMAARRFLRCVRDCDTLARLGGDEICVVLPRTRNAGDAEVIATRLLGAAWQPLPINDRHFCGGVSVGIALFPDNDATSGEWIAAADAPSPRRREVERTAMPRHRRGSVRRYLVAADRLDRRP